MDAANVLSLEERQIIGKLWRQIRGPTNRRGFFGSIGALDAVPHLASSLASLCEQGYGWEDVALMFGVTGKVVRRWGKRVGIRSVALKARYRIWCAAQSRFLPVSADQCPTRSVGVRAVTRNLLPTIIIHV